MQAAADLFMENGYHATGMTELEAATGLRRGALYYHIGSKEELLYEICARSIQSLVENGESMREDGHSPEQQFRLLSRFLIEAIAENRAGLTVYFREGITSLTGERAERMMALRDRFQAIMTAILRDGLADGTFNSADSITVNAVLGLHNYTYLWLDPGGILEPAAVAERFCDLLLDGIRTRGVTAVG